MEYQNIVCGVTGSAHAQKAALEAAVLAKRHNANLIYVYAVDITFLRGGFMLPHQHVEESLETLGNHILELAAQIALTQGVTPKKILHPGSNAEENPEKGDRPGSFENRGERGKGGSPGVGPREADLFRKGHVQG